MRKLREYIERWICNRLRPQRTRRIEEEKRRYMSDYYDIRQYLRQLQAVSDEHASVVQALQKRMGV